MQKGAEMNARSKRGKTSLMYATQNGCVNGTKTLFRQTFIDLTIYDNFVKTALMAAGEKGHAVVYSFLVICHPRLLPKEVLDFIKLSIKSLNVKLRKLL